MKRLSKTERQRADTLLVQAHRNLAELSELTGIRAFSIEFAGQQPRIQAEVITEPSHVPTRHPVVAYPQPRPGQRGENGLLHSAPSLELERRQGAVVQWCRRKKKLPPSIKDFDDWNVQHHAECLYELTAQPCDCGFLIRARIAGEVFVVMADGKMERYLARPVTPEAFRELDGEAFEDEQWTVDELLRLIPMKLVGWQAVGEGEEERFISKPGTGQFQQFLDRMIKEERA